MNLSWIDWAMVVVAIVGIRLVSMSTRTHMKGVADFLSGNRCAGRYLLSISGQMGSTGVISVVAMFQMYYAAGFTGVWWGMLMIMVPVVISLTGWVFYRFRETRALTMAQFLEMRYSRRFRVTSGILCFISGMLNFGIFPAVAAHFFIYYLGLPEYFHIPGISLAISTFATIMIADLGLALAFVLMGGQISVMVTECAQGIVCCIAFVVVSAYCLLHFNWGSITSALSMAQVDASMIHPFHTSKTSDFNAWFFIIGVIGAFYGYMSWQGSQGFFCSARSPHEQKMGNIIGAWREMPKTLMILILPMIAYMVLHLPEFSAKAVIINEAVKHISNPAIQDQMRVPITLAHVLPVGIKGLLAVIMIFFSFTCHDTYMHSWGSIFVQDVLLPLRKKPLEPEEHIAWLRRSIVGVAVFSFIFSLIYPQSQKILMFMAITGTLWLGGSGAAIVGGLYWKKGTTAGAYIALAVGAIVGVFGLIYPQIYQSQFHKAFPINSQWLSLIAMVIATLAYVVVSLYTCRGSAFEIEKILNRGRHAQTGGALIVNKTSFWQRLIGITEEFSKGDRMMAITLVIWNLGWFAFFLTVTIMNLIKPFGNVWWSALWHTYVWMYLLISIPSTVWFTVGGIKDIKALFYLLENTERDHSDDGTVGVRAESEKVAELEQI